MSDISLHFPLWIVVVILAIDYWPLALALGLLFAAWGLYVRGRWRIVLLVLALVMLLPCAGALFVGLQRRHDAAQLARQEAATTSTLAAPRTVDGFLLPAGTFVRWTDPTHTHLVTASLAAPARFADLTVVDFVQGDSDGWKVSLAADGLVGEWLCKADFVRLTADGHFAQCRTAADTRWKGWSLPAGTQVEADERRGLTSLVVPNGTTVDVARIGTVTPMGAFFVFSDDGSPQRMYFDPEKPLVVHGVRLWNTVTWLYGGPAHRQGGAVAVSGPLLDAVTRDGATLAQNEQTRIDLETGRLTRCAFGCGE